MLKSLNKFLAIGIIVVSVLALNPIGASASWKQDNNGWWNTEGSSYSTGWRTIDGKWYYFNSNGYMVHDTIIDGYRLGSSGEWIQNNNIQANSDTVNNNTSNNSNVNSLSDLQNSLNDKYSTLDTPIGKLKFKFTINTDNLGVSDYDCWVQAGYGEITNSPYGIEFFSPYILEYSNKISDTDKEKTKELLKNYQKYIGEAFITGSGKNNKKVMGGFYNWFYKYPNLKVGYESTKFLTWRNYDDGGNITAFNWYTAIDDYDFTK